MSEVENALPQGSEQVYESLFGSEINTTTVLFATPHPFNAGSGGHDLYQVSVLKNGQWVIEPVQVRWEDANKQLVVGLYAGGPISGIRLYHIGDSTGLRKPTSINANPPAGLPHAMEVSEMAIVNAGFEERGFVNLLGEDSSFKGWSVDFHYPQGNAYDSHRGSVGISGTTTLEQTLAATFDPTAKYELSVGTKRFSGGSIPKEHLQLWAGDALIGDMILSATDADKEYRLTVDGINHTTQRGQPLRIKIAPDSSNEVEAGILLDNFHLRKLTQSMASFAVPADGCTAVTQSRNENIFPELTVAGS